VDLDPSLKYLDTSPVLVVATVVTLAAVVGTVLLGADGLDRVVGVTALVGVAILTLLSLWRR